MKPEHILVILIFVSKATIVHCSPVIFYAGCANMTSVLVTNVLKSNGTTSLINNYPGTCLAYCDRVFTSKDTQYIALLETHCLCGKIYTNITDISGCSDTCPGHDDHICGSAANNFYSIAIIERAMSVSPFSCIQFHYDTKTTKLEEANCTTDAQGLCFRKGVPAVCGVKITDTWSGMAKKLRFHNSCFPQDTYKTCHASTCPSIKFPTKTCLKSIPYWILAFGQWAPQKNCVNLTSPVNGDWTFYNNDDNETVTYSCSPGYKLAGDVTRSCMANKTWSGHRPDCISLKVSSTTTQPITTQTTPSTKTTITSGETTTTKKTQSSSAGDEGLSIVEIIGIVVGAIVGFHVIGSIITCIIIICTKKNSRTDDAGEADNNRQGEHQNTGIDDSSLAQRGHHGTAPAHDRIYHTSYSSRSHTSTLVLVSSDDGSTTSSGTNGSDWVQSTTTVHETTATQGIQPLPVIPETRETSSKSKGTGLKRQTTFSKHK